MIQSDCWLQTSRWRLATWESWRRPQSSWWLRGTHRSPTAELPSPSTRSAQYCMVAHKCQPSSTDQPHHTDTTTIPHYFLWCDTALHFVVSVRCRCLVSGRRLTLVGHHNVDTTAVTSSQSHPHVQHLVASNYCCSHRCEKLVNVFLLVAYLGFIGFLFFECF